MANAGISGSDVQDMMLEAVEARFGTHRAPQPVEMLTDNGSAYTAKDTRIFARQLSLKPCFTPVRSPQSNGVPEAFSIPSSASTSRSRPCQTPEPSSE